eukprot:7348962-Prymnesium_polylepis.1
MGPVNIPLFGYARGCLARHRLRAVAAGTSADVRREQDERWVEGGGARRGPEPSGSVHLIC